MKKNKGITLIALVITIIVMLILVAVTINLAVNGGLFGHAGKAAKDTELAKNEELKLASGGVTVDGITYESMDAYKTSLSCEHIWGNEEIIKEATCSEEGEHIVTCSKCGAQKKEKMEKTNHIYANNAAWEIIPEEGKEKNTCSVCGQEIKRYIVGATIKGYDPTNNGTINTSYTSLGSYDSTSEGEYGDGSTGNGNSNKTIELKNLLEWKILGEENDQLIITPMFIGNQGTIGFKGASGYAHYIEELNKICSIYGQGKYADTTKFSLARDVKNQDGTLVKQEIINNASGARSINIDDFKRIGYDVTEESISFRKDETNNKIYNESISSTNSRFETFFYWSEYAKDAKAPYSFVALKPGERVTIKGIKNVTGSITTLAKKMLSEYYKYNGDNYNIYFVANQSFRIDYDSEENPVQGLLKYVPITGTASAGRDYEIVRSDLLDFGIGVLRLFRPVVYLGSDVTVTYDAENVEYTINP